MRKAERNTSLSLEIQNTICVKQEEIITKYIKSKLSKRNQKILQSAVSAALEQTNNLKDYISPDRPASSVIGDFKCLSILAKKLIPNVSSLLTDARAMDLNHEAIQRLRNKLPTAKQRDKLQTISEYHHAYGLLKALQTNLIAAALLADEVVENYDPKPGGEMNFRSIPVAILAQAWFVITKKKPAFSNTQGCNDKSGPFMRFINAFYESINHVPPTGNTVKAYLSEHIDFILN